MKKTYHLIRVAKSFANKYAQSQSLQQIIENAAGYGEKSPNGIMNFPAQLKKDQADLSILVTVDTGMMGGFNVVVYPPTVDPPQYAQNYAVLPAQIKKYLERHIKDFPQVPMGISTLRYSGKNVESGIASNP
jgi:hypothetical protein